MSCRSSKVHAGARWLAHELFRNEEHVYIDAPIEEELSWRDGVFGLDSIVPRFVPTRQLLSERKPTHLLMIGGTCGAEAAPISYLNELNGGKVAIVWFDAHGDLNTPQTSPSGDFHGMVLRMYYVHFLEKARAPSAPRFVDHYWLRPRYFWLAHVPLMQRSTNISLNPIFQYS